MPWLRSKPEDASENCAFLVRNDHAQCAADPMQMNVRGSKLLQTRCHILTNVGLLAWGAYWHRYIETIGRACTANHMTTCAGLARQLTSKPDHPFFTAGFQEISGLLAPPGFAEAHRNSVNRNHITCMCIGHTHRPCSKYAYMRLISQSENESADRDSLCLQRTSLTVETTSTKSVWVAQTYGTPAKSSDNTSQVQPILIVAANSATMTYAALAEVLCINALSCCRQISSYKEMTYSGIIDPSTKREETIVLMYTYRGGGQQPNTPNGEPDLGSNNDLYTSFSGSGREWLSNNHITKCVLLYAAHAIP